MKSIERRIAELENRKSDPEGERIVVTLDGESVSFRSIEELSRAFVAGMTAADDDDIIDSGVG